ncbi:MAG TPA: Asp-tRNA(Asn)/Glu-tRNA(Gln) amidotransferase subunit GatC, partial [Myxococcota bacterium]
MITRADVEHAAHLARLRLREDEVARFTHDLERIVAHIETLMAVDVTGVAPMLQPFAQQSASPRRPDVTEPVLGAAALAGSAGLDASARVVKVPRVIE